MVEFPKVMKLIAEGGDPVQTKIIVETLLELGAGAVPAKENTIVPEIVSSLFGNMDNKSIN
jgi:hypothetical protein